MENKIKKVLESDFSNSKESFEDYGHLNEGYEGEGDIFNRYDYENLLGASESMLDEHADLMSRAESRELDLKGQLETAQEKDKNLIHITDNELRCIITGLEWCSGEDFDPLYDRMCSIDSNRKDRKLKNMHIEIDGEKVDLPLSILKMIKGAL